MQNNPTLTSAVKSTCERYDLRFESSGWAVFLISEDGFLSVQSDYGDYSHHWGSIGTQTFKEFLLDLNSDYLLGKFVGSASNFQFERTLKLIRADICTQRKQRIIDSSQARLFYDDLRSCESHDVDLFMQDFMDTYAFELYGDSGSVPTVVDYSYQERFFCEKVFPLFKEVLKKEISLHP